MIAAFSALSESSQATWHHRRQAVCDVSSGALLRVCATLREVEDLLDWLEGNGHPATEVTCTDDGFIVW
jgi:hypothetical protein